MIYGSLSPTNSDIVVPSARTSIRFPLVRWLLSCFRNDAKLGPVSILAACMALTAIRLSHLRIWQNRSINFTQYSSYNSYNDVDNNAINKDIDGIASARKFEYLMWL
jgi:hypothetical protein